MDFILLCFAPIHYYPTAYVKKNKRKSKTKVKQEVCVLTVQKPNFEPDFIFNPISNNFEGFAEKYPRIRDPHVSSVIRFLFLRTQPTSVIT